MRTPRIRPALALGVSAVVLAAGAGTGALFISSASAATIPVDRMVTGKATYYDDAGYGACGTQIDAKSQMLVAVSHTYWTTANPNVDPLCSGISVQATYGGTTVTVPVVDKCPSCDATHIDLSEPAFARLADPSVGVLTGLTWKFVRTGAAAAAPASGTDTADTAGTTPTAPARSTEPAASCAPVPTAAPAPSFPSVPVPDRSRRTCRHSTVTDGTSQDRHRHSGRPRCSAE